MTINKRYEIEKIVGQGGFSIAYKGFDRETQQYILLKEFIINEQDQDNFVKRVYQTEYQVTAALSHPSLNKPYDFFEENGKYYLVSKFISGGTLFDYIKTQPTKIQLIDILTQILYGLDYLHSKGVVHRDIKPENILIEPFPLRAYLSDFGPIFSKEQRTSIGTQIGTVNYAAPEQLLYSYKLITPATDLWSFGVTVYFLLLGEHPYDIYNLTDDLSKIKNLDNIEEPFKTIVRKCLIKDVNNRVQSAKDLIKDLLSYDFSNINNNTSTFEISIVKQQLDEIQELTKNLREDIGWLKMIQEKIMAILPNKEEKIKILFLGANPTTTPLKLDEEVRKISTNLKLSKNRDNLELKQEWAVTVDSLLQAVLDESPNFVHFSGHGNIDGIIIQDEIGRPHKMTTETLDDLFGILKETVVCVILNSCYSVSQAEVIKKHIPYVIGMSSAVPDDTAIAFASGFYRGIGAKKDIPSAYKIGVIEAKAKGLNGSQIPVLLKDTSIV